MKIIKSLLLTPLLLISFSLTASEYLEYTFPKDEQENWKLVVKIDHHTASHEIWETKDEKSALLAYEKTLQISSYPKYAVPYEGNEDVQNITAQSYLAYVLELDEEGKDLYIDEGEEVTTQVISDQEHDYAVKQWIFYADEGSFSLTRAIDTEKFLYFIRLDEDAKNQDFTLDQDKWIESVMNASIVQTP